MRLYDFVRKFWISGKSENVEDFKNLPLATPDVVALVLSSKVIRKFTVEVVNRDEVIEDIVIRDDGNGNLVATRPKILSSGTGVFSTINYNTSTATIHWDADFINSRTVQPMIRFKNNAERYQEHAELQDFVTEVLGDYKVQELDQQLDFFNPEKIPSHHFDTISKEHNWVLDRYYSETEGYLRRQIKNIYPIYKSKRRLDGIAHAITVIKKKVKLYNYLAKKGNTDAESKSLYENVFHFIRFLTDDLLKLVQNPNNTTPQKEAYASQVETIYESLFGSSYYPIKHFLLEMGLSSINDDGSLLNPRDINTLRNYVLKIVSKSQYPHFAVSLSVKSFVELTNQDGADFNFKLQPDEIMFYVSDYETVTSGPSGVYSRAITGGGAWAILPLLFNESHTLNQGWLANMSLADISSYISSFKVGTGSHGVITNTLTDLQTPILTSNFIKYTYDATYQYFTCTVKTMEAVDQEITEMGLFNGGGDMVFYMTFPKIVKEDKYEISFKIRVVTSPAGDTGSSTGTGP